MPPRRVEDYRQYIEVGVLVPHASGILYGQMGAEISGPPGGRLRGSASIGFGIGRGRTNFVPILSGGLGVNYDARWFAHSTLQGLLHFTPQYGLSPMVSVGLEGSFLRLLITSLAGLGALVVLVYF